MIYFVTTERFSSTITGLLASYPPAKRHLRSLTYEELFFERSGPIGHYIFTDFDRLTRFELESAICIARALECAAPEARVLNDPLRALERFPLLIELNKAGINDFTAIRLETGESPDKYPVFIRAEDGYAGPETDLIPDSEAYVKALADLKVRGLPRRGRIAVGYAAEPGGDGYFRKFAAFGIGDRIIPLHMMCGPTWAVKNNVAETPWMIRRDPNYRFSEPIVAEELSFVRDNPHREVLARAFKIAGMEFGRVDFGLVNGRVQVYEINSNPTMSWKLKNDGRDDRRLLIRERAMNALAAIDIPLPKAGRFRFTERRPRDHNLHLPRWRFAASIFRRSVQFGRAAN